MIKYSWEINKVDKTSTDNLSDIIQTVHWYAEATDGVHVVHEVGELELDEPETNRFIEFTNLTKQDIVDWLHANLDTGAIQSSLGIKLQELQG
jgi:hypothetical protein